VDRPPYHPGLRFLCARRLCRNAGLAGRDIFGPGFCYCDTVSRAKWLETPLLVPDEAILLLEFVQGALNGLTGMVTYPQEFLDA
jgi:hypothetical protein